MWLILLSILIPWQYYSVRNHHDALFRYDSSTSTLASTLLMFTGNVLLWKFQHEWVWLMSLWIGCPQDVLIPCGRGRVWVQSSSRFSLPVRHILKGSKEWLKSWVSCHWCGISVNFLTRTNHCRHLGSESDGSALSASLPLHLSLYQRKSPACQINKSISVEQNIYLVVTQKAFYSRPKV